MLDAIVAPSILSGDFGDLGADSLKIVEAGADWLHVDIMDGHFVPNISFGPMVVKGLRAKLPKERMFFDCHMMVSNPLQWIDDMAAAGGCSYTFHYEACEETNNHQEVIDAIRKAGMKVGLAVKPKTPIEVVYPFADSVDMILVMTVEPGFGGQSFMPDMMPKVAAVRERFPNVNVEVDGGLGADNVDKAASSGANVVVAGTSVYKSANPAETIKLLRTAIERHLVN